MKGKPIEYAHRPKMMHYALFVMDSIELEREINGNTIGLYNYSIEYVIDESKK